MPAAGPPAPLPAHRRALLAAAASLLLPARSQAASRAASPWPTGPVRLLVAGVPGGPADRATRWLAEPLARQLAQPVLVEPVPGAGGLIAVQHLAAARRDGHCFLVAVNSVVSEAPLAADAGSDPLRQLQPLCEIAAAPLVLLAGPAVAAGVTGLPQLQDWVRGQPAPVLYASYSAGSLGHALGRLWARAAGLRLEHVPYRGSPDALLDLAAGRVPLMFDVLPSCWTPLQQQRGLRAVAVSAPRRVPQLPAVPTFVEQRLPGLDASAWMALWNHRGEHPAPADALRRAVLQQLQQPALRSRLQEAGFTPAAGDDRIALQQRVGADTARIRDALQAELGAGRVAGARR